MDSRMRSASLAASAELVSGQQDGELIAPETRGGIHAANLRLDALRDLLERDCRPPGGRSRR